MKDYINANFNDIFNGNFVLYEGNPIVKHFGVNIVLADPSVLTPDKTHDGLWHMFCHSLLGIYHFESKDGIDWTRKGRVTPRAMRPDISVVDGKYYLYYEGTESILKKAISLVGGKWLSKIYLITSTDLEHWSKPTLIIDSTKPYMTDKQGTSISNPFLTKFEDKYRLYFSAGLTYIKDCGFSEPTHIAYAESNRLDGDFDPINTPIISPDKNNEYLNLCSGCIKVYRLNDCYIALQNGIYQKGNKSHSSIMLLRSDDGINFEFSRVFLDPCVTSGKHKNWMKQYVYACNLVDYDGGFRLYFNARNCADNLRGREHIGVMIANKNICSTGNALH